MGESQVPSRQSHERGNVRCARQGWRGPSAGDRADASREATLLVQTKEAGKQLSKPRGVQRKQKESKEKLIGFSTPAGLGEQRTVGECELGTRASKGGAKKRWHVGAGPGLVCMHGEASNMIEPGVVKLGRARAT